MGISYLITVCNEENEFFKLLDHLAPFLRDEDELIIKVDNSKTTNKILSSFNDDQFLHKYKINFVLIRDFNGDFAEWKNEMISHANNSIIFFIDADELPNPVLLEELPIIVELNENVDVFRVPRINYVEGITEDYIKLMGWHKNEQGRINWPDFQTRIMRNKPGIKWGGEVHETLQGGRLKIELPAEDEYALLHIKTFEKQILQNIRYISQDYSK